MYLNQIARNKSLRLIGPHSVRDPLLESGDPRVDPAARAQVPVADNARDVPLASGRVLLHEGAPAVALARVFRVQRVRVAGANLRRPLEFQIGTGLLHRNGHLLELG